jgi:hypothetical protein
MKIKSLNICLLVMTLASLAAAQEFPNPDRLTSAVISVEGYSGQLNGWLTEDGKFLLGETQTLRTKIKLHWKVSGAELSRSQIVSLCDSYKSNKEDSYEVSMDLPEGAANKYFEKKISLESGEQPSLFPQGYRLQRPSFLIRTKWHGPGGPDASRILQEPLSAAMILNHNFYDGLSSKLNWNLDFYRFCSLAKDLVDFSVVQQISYISAKPVSKFMFTFDELDRLYVSLKTDTNQLESTNRSLRIMYATRALQKMYFYPSIHPLNKQIIMSQLMDRAMLGKVENQKEWSQEINERMKDEQYETINDQLSYSLEIEE